MLVSTASVSIIPLERTALRSEIECPGDTISYNCSIESNSEAVQLTWRVTIPEQMPVNITYSDMTDSVTNLTSYISTSVTGFQSDQYIHSYLEITVQPNISSQIMLECFIADLGNDTSIVFINASCKNNNTQSIYLITAYF